MSKKSPKPTPDDRPSKAALRVRLICALAERPQGVTSFDVMQALNLNMRAATLVLLRLGKAGRIYRDGVLKYGSGRPAVIYRRNRIGLQQVTQPDPRNDQQKAA